MLLPGIKQKPCHVAGGLEFAGLERGRAIAAAHWMHPIEAGLRWFGAGGCAIRQVRRSGYMPTSRLSVGRARD